MPFVIDKVSYTITETTPLIAEKFKEKPDLYAIKDQLQEAMAFTNACISDELRTVTGRKVFLENIQPNLNDRIRRM